MHPYHNTYTVGDKIFPTKLFALNYCEQMGYPFRIKWNLTLFENALSRENLLSEPVESLETLYLQRAIHLRESYNYLILFYSGGADSHQILETFLLNKIHLDEVCIYAHSRQSHVKSLKNLQIIVPDYYEPIKSAIPQAKFLIEKFSPRTKLTIIEDYEQTYVDWWLNVPKSKDSFIKCSSLGILHKFVPRAKDITQLHKNWTFILEKNKIGFIFGKEKVRLKYDETGFFITMPDTDVIDHVDIHFQLSQKNLPNNIELFFIHPDFVKIHIKQAHTIINTLTKEQLINVVQTPNCRKLEDQLSDIIYSIKYPRLYTGLKYSDFKNRSTANPKEWGFGAVDSSDTNLAFMLLHNYTALQNYRDYLKFIGHNFFHQKDELHVVERFKYIAWSKPHYVKML